MKRIILTIALLALLAAGSASAQGELTLESVSTRLEALIGHVTTALNRINALEDQQAQLDLRLKIIETGAREIAEEMVRADHAYSGIDFESLPVDRQEDLINIAAPNLTEAALLCEIPVRELAWIVNFWALFLESQGVTMQSMGHGDANTTTSHRLLLVALIPLGLAMTPDQNCDDGISGMAAAYLESHKENQ